MGNLSAAVKLPIKQRFLGNPTLETNLGSRILAVRTGCSTARAPRQGGAVSEPRSESVGLVTVMITIIVVSAITIALIIPMTMYH